MPVKIPRLVRDSKTGIFYFRYTLPRHLATQIDQTSIYTSLRTRNNKQARAMAAMLNYGIEMSKPIDLSKVRELLKINIADGVFEADTESEQERGLRILEQMARLRSTAAASPNRSEERRSVPATVIEPVTPIEKRKSRKMGEVEPFYIQEIDATLRPATVYKHRQTLKLFLGQAGDQSIDAYTKDDIKSFKTRMLNEGKVAHTINQCLSHLRSFFAFATNNGYAEIEQNPVDDMFIKHAKNNIKKRDMFYDDDLAVIFDWKNYRC